MAGNILVSAIVPCSKQVEHLFEALQSVASQTITDWECIIIGDDSSNTRDAALDLVKDPRFRFLDCPDKGITMAGNSWIDKVKGRYIQFLDANDIIAPNKWEIQSGIMSRTDKLGLACSDYYYRKHDGTLYDEAIYKPPDLDVYDLLRNTTSWCEPELRIPVSSFLFDSRFFREFGIGTADDLSGCEDWEYWMHIFRLKPVLFFQNSKLAACRYCDDFSMRNQRYTLKNFMEAVDRPPNLRKHDKELVDI